MKNLTINSKMLLKTGLFLFFVLSAYFVNAQISTTTITVKSKSVDPTGATAATPSICNGGNTDISVVGGSLGTNATWNWYEDACPTGTETEIGTGATITVAPPNATTATITKTYYVRAEGDCNNTECQSVTITIFATPVVTPPANATYCVGTSVPLQALTGTPTGITYDISGGADVGLADATGLTEIPAFTATNTTNASITRTITIVPKANGCTGTSQTFTITVTPDVVIVPISDQIVCNGTSTTAVTITSNVASGVVYNWTNDTPGIGLAASGTGDIATFTGVNTTCADIVATITVTPVLTEGTTDCTEGTETFTITVRPTPLGTIASNDPICEGDQAQLTFTSTCGTGPFTLNIQQEGNAPPYTEYNTVVSGTAFDVDPNPLTPGLHTYNLYKITDANGCIKE